LKTCCKILLTGVLGLGLANTSFGDEQGNQGYISRTEVQSAPSNTEHLNSTQANAPFQISVDGKPLDSSNLSNSADVTRQKDMALAAADIQIRFDGFETTPVLNVTAFPDAAVRGEEVTFTPYSNYAAFIKKAELRIFPAGESLQKEPLAVVDVSNTVDTDVTWQVPERSRLEAVDYVLRVYDGKGHFDETEPKLLHFLDKSRLVGDE